MVRQLHHAAALDTVAPNTGARLRLWPSIGARLRDGALLRSLVRAGALGALRRWLQTTGDSATTAGATEVMRLRAAVLAGLRALAPYVGAPQMNMSRGLGKLLLLLADAPSTDASIAALAKQTSGGSDSASGESEKQTQPCLGGECFRGAFLVGAACAFASAAVTCVLAARCARVYARLREKLVAAEARS